MHNLSAAAPPQEPKLRLIPAVHATIASVQAITKVPATALGVLRGSGRIGMHGTCAPAGVHKIT